VAGPARRTGSPVLSTGRRKPASSKHSRTAATQKARPPRARPRAALASSSVRPTASGPRISRSTSSTAPPGNTWAPPANTSRRLRRTMNTSSPTAPSRTSITVAASRTGTLTGAPPSAAARELGAFYIGSLASARSLAEALYVIDAALDATTGEGTAGGPHRREQQEQTHDVGEEAGRQQEGAGEEDEGPVDQLAPGDLAGVDLALRPPPRAQALALHEPGADEADQHQEGEGVHDAEHVADLDDHVQLRDRHEDEDQRQQAEHGVSVVLATLLARGELGRAAQPRSPAIGAATRAHLARPSAAQERARDDDAPADGVPRRRLQRHRSLRLLRVPTEQERAAGHQLHQHLRQAVQGRPQRHRHRAGRRQG